MRVLWLYYHVPEYILSEFPEEDWITGTGWVDSLLNRLIKEDCIKCGIIFPVIKSEGREGIKENVNYFSYKKKESNEQRGIYFENVIKRYMPDIIHVWGSEAEASKQMIQICNKLKVNNKLVLNLQGMCFICYIHFKANIPNRFFYGFTLRDLVKWDNLYLQQKKFYKRGKEELQAIRSVQNVIGRTDWDQACIKKVNPYVRYYFCNEILRESFYEGKWDLSKCKKYSIFMSQGSYSIKGLHYVLEALRYVKSKYPGVTLRVAGLDYMKPQIGIMGKLKVSGYAKYIQYLIKKNDLSDSISFLGVLNEEHMKKEYLRANVFISASTVENESNSLSEAKMLGVPVIASFVGGVTNRIVHNEDGYAYQHDSVYMLEYYICKVFDDPQKSIQLGKTARENALKVNNIATNISQVKKIYMDIIAKNREELN